MNRTPTSITQTLNARLFILAFIVLVTSCQRELAIETTRLTSGGLLLKESSGVCAQVQVAGTYINDKPLNDSNYLEVLVNVTSPGAYAINTDTVNGYSFIAAGNFSGIGSTRVRLNGLGKPLIHGTDRFSVYYNSSVCAASVTVRSNVIGPADYTLAGAPNSCLSDTLYGSYAKGIALDTSSKIRIALNVTTPGTYTISTNMVNGYKFLASGTFASAGLQNVFLSALGTPLNSGTDVFTITGLTSACGFSLMVLQPVTVHNNDYFPLTANSYWTYDDVRAAGDSVKRTVIGDTMIGSLAYRIIKEDVRFGAPNRNIFRKSGSDYFEYAPTDKYTTSFQFKKKTNVELRFLKENLVTGNAWSSDEFTDTASFGQVLKLRYDYILTNSNATITINGKAFANVYTIEMRPYLRTLTDPWGATGEVYHFYYAKGVGLIYYKKLTQAFVNAELQIRRWQVN